MIHLMSRKGLWVPLPALLFLGAASFASESPKSDSQMAFFQAVETLASSSPQLQSDLQMARGRMAELQSGRYAHLPSLSGGLTLDQAQNLEDNNDVSRSTRADIEARATLYHFGADAARIERARVAEDILNEESLALRIAAEKEMALKVIRWIELDKKNSLNGRIIEAREKLLDQAGRLYAKGLLAAEELDGNRLDVGLSKIAHEENLLLAQTLKDELLRKLNEAILPVEWPFGQGVGQNLSYFEELSAEAMILAMAPQASRLKERQLEKSRAELQQIRAESYPSLSAFTGVGKNFGYWQAETESPLRWNVGVRLNWTLFSRYEDTAQIEGAVLKLQAAERAKEAFQINFLDKVREAEGRIRSLSRSIKTRENYLERASGNLKRARERFLSGRISSNELSNEETKTLELEQSLIGTVASLHASFFSLCETLVIELSSCASRIAETKSSK